MGEKKLKTEATNSLNDEFIMIEAVMEFASVSKRFVMEEIKLKKLRAYKPGKRLLFKPADVREWISRKVVK